MPRPGAAFALSSCVTWPRCWASTWCTWLPTRTKFELHVAKRANVAHVLRALNAYVYDADLSECKSLMHRNVVINTPGPSDEMFWGEYRGMDGLQTMHDRVRELVAWESPFEIHTIRKWGNTSSFRAGIRCAS